MASGGSYSPAVEAARARRVGAAEARIVRTEWFIKEVMGKIAMPLRTRVKVATEYLKDQIVRNLSVPVIKVTSLITGRIVVLAGSRSKPGEFPRADTTQLMKSIFSDYKEESPNSFVGMVGTPIDYGVILELRMQRSFMVRTLNEQRGMITQILTGPIAA